MLCKVLLHENKFHSLKNFRDEVFAGIGGSLSAYDPNISNKMEGKNDKEKEMIIKTDVCQKLMTE